MHRARVTVSTLLLTLLLGGPALAQGGPPEANTLAELTTMYGDEACRECHGDVYEEWEASWHSRSVTAATGILAKYIRSGLGEQWKKPLTKAELLKCLYCHAPAVSRASEELARKIGEWVLQVESEPPSAGIGEARQKLARLNVGCTVCHNLRATTFLPGLAGEPKPGAVYGATGASAPGHETIPAPQLQRALFCMQCHGRYTAPDGELLTCATIPGSYQNAYQGRGGAETCQDCHMAAKGRGHRMPGGHDLEIVRDGLTLELEVAPYRHLPGQIPGVQDKTSSVPSALVTAFVGNRAGHRVPDG